MHWIELRQEDCDAAYLMQTVHVLLRIDRLPRALVTVRFEFTVQPKIYWLIVPTSPTRSVTATSGSMARQPGARLPDVAQGEPPLCEVRARRPAADREAVAAP